jgi:hypothetical protein
MRLRVASFAAILRQDMGWLDSTENSTGQADSFYTVKKGQPFYRPQPGCH